MDGFLMLYTTRNDHLQPLPRMLHKDCDQLNNDQFERFGQE